MITFDIEELKRSKKGKLKLAISNDEMKEIKFFWKLKDLKTYLIKKINLLEIR